MSIDNKNFGIALIQMHVGDDLAANVDRAIERIREAVRTHKPTLVCLPECFNSPYGVDQFDKYAEYIPSGYTSQRLAKVASELKVYVLGGTIPERDADDKRILYNTATVFGPNGELLAKHRKAHLYDIDLKGLHSFAESSALTPGDKLTTFTINKIKFGLGVCFDIYFDEYARALRNSGCDMIFYPAAFNMFIGPLHWDLLNRARATDNQVYVATISPARDASADYVAWGHSMFADPWGRILQQAGDQEETVFQRIDFTGIASLREQIPLFGKRRPDIYKQQNIQ